MSQISAHPLVRAQSKVQRPWALFRETTGYFILPPKKLVYCSIQFTEKGPLEVLPTHGQITIQEQEAVNVFRLGPDLWYAIIVFAELSSDVK